MLRIALTVLLPLLGPALLYLFYITVVQRRAAARGEPVPPLGEGPWGWLAVAGLALTAALFLLLAMVGDQYTGGGPPGAEYQAPRYEDGKIIPGQLKPRQ